jgi:hypothetical protein
MDAEWQLPKAIFNNGRDWRHFPFRPSAFAGQPPDARSLKGLAVTIDQFISDRR